MWCSNCPNFDTCEDRPSWAVDATLTEPTISVSIPVEDFDEVD